MPEVMKIKAYVGELPPFVAYPATRPELLIAMPPRGAPAGGKEISVLPKVVRNERLRKGRYERCSRTWPELLMPYTLLFVNPLGITLTMYGCAKATDDKAIAATAAANERK